MWDKIELVACVVVALALVVGTKLITDPWRCQWTGSCHLYYSTPAMTPGTSATPR